jgi:hypothetical protein
LQPLGIVVFSGLSLSTVLTLFIVPCLYLLLHSGLGSGRPPAIGATPPPIAPPMAPSLSQSRSPRSPWTTTPSNPPTHRP